MHVCTYIYLFIIREPTPDAAGSVRVNAKERNKKERQRIRAKERKGIEAQGAKPPTPTRGIDAFTGGEEQNEKLKKKKKETGRGAQTQLPYTLRSPLTTRKDHTHTHTS